MPLQTLLRQCALALRVSGTTAVITAASLGLLVETAHAKVPTQSAVMPKASKALMLDVVQAGDRLVAVGERGHLLLSDDKGATWKQIVVPTVAMLTAVHFPSASRGWAVGHDGVILATEDGGNTWVEQRNEGRNLSADAESPPPLMDVWFKDESTGWAVGAFGTVLETQDGGKNWVSIADRLNNPDGFHINAVAGKASGEVFLGSESGVVFRSRDAGASWERLDTGYDGSLFGLLVSRVDGAIYALGLRGTIMKSSDDGTTWTKLKPGSDASFAGAYEGGGAIYVVGSSGVLLVSRNQGASFELHQREGNQSLSSVVELSPAQVLVAGQDGLRTMDVGAPAAQK